MARQRACATEFASHDGDGDGKMSPAELEAALESLPKSVRGAAVVQLDLRKCVGAQVLSILESSSGQRRLQESTGTRGLYLSLYSLKYSGADNCYCVSMVPVADADVSAVASLPEECRGRVWKVCCKTRPTISMR